MRRVRNNTRSLRRLRNYGATARVYCAINISFASRVSFRLLEVFFLRRCQAT